MPTRIATARARTAGALADEVRMKLGGAGPTLAIAIAPAQAELAELLAELDGVLPATTLAGVAGAAFTEAGAAGDAFALFAVAGDLRVFARGDLPGEASGYPHGVVLPFGVAIFSRTPLGVGESAADARAELDGADVAGAFVVGVSLDRVGALREELACVPLAGLTSGERPRVIAFPR